MQKGSSQENIEKAVYPAVDRMLQLVLKKRSNLVVATGVGKAQDSLKMLEKEGIGVMDKAKRSKSNVVKEIGPVEEESVYTCVYMYEGIKYMYMFEGSLYMLRTISQFSLRLVNNNFCGD